MGNDIRVSQPNASSIYDQLTFNTDKTTAPVKDADTEQESTQIETQDTTDTDQPVKGRVPASNISFDDGPIQEQAPDDGGLPSMEDLENSQNNQQIGDPNELPPLDNPNPYPNEGTPEDYKPETNKDHSINKAVAHLEAGFVKKGINNLAIGYVKRATANAVTKELTEVVGKTVVGKGAAKTGADLAGKITAGTAKGLEKSFADLTAKGLLGKGVQTIGVKEGAKAAGNLVKGLEESSKAASEILLQGGAKKILPNTVNALSKTSIGAGEKVLQEGLQKGTDIAVKNVLKNLAPETAGKVVTEAVTKGAAKGAAKTTAKTAAKVTTEAAAKAGTKVGTKTAAKVAAETGVKVSTKAGIKAGTKVATKTTAETAAKAGSKTVEKMTAEAVTKATTEVTAKGGVKFATKVGKAMPYVGAAINVGITAWDAKDALDKQKDQNASTVSKVLAWTTVGLDAVSTVTTATGKGAPIGWAATGLSIGTSILSDYTR